MTLQVDGQLRSVRNSNDKVDAQCQPSGNLRRFETNHSNISVSKFFYKSK